MGTICHSWSKAATHGWSSGMIMSIKQPLAPKACTVLCSSTMLSSSSSSTAAMRRPAAMCAQRPWPRQHMQRSRLPTQQHPCTPHSSKQAMVRGCLSPCIMLCCLVSKMVWIVVRSFFILLSCDDDQTRAASCSPSASSVLYAESCKVSCRCAWPVSRADGGQAAPAQRSASAGGPSALHAPAAAHAARRAAQARCRVRYPGSGAAAARACARVPWPSWEDAPGPAWVWTWRTARLCRPCVSGAQLAAAEAVIQALQLTHSGMVAQ